MKKMRLDPDDLVVSSFEADGKRGVKALTADYASPGFTVSCRLNCTYVTCYAGCETNQYGAC